MTSSSLVCSTLKIKHLRENRECFFFFYFDFFDLDIWDSNAFSLCLMYFFVDADDSLAEGALQILDAAVGSGIFDIVAFNFQRYYESRNTTDFGTGLWTAEFKSGWYYFCDVAGKMAPGTFGCVCGRAYSRRLYSELRYLCSNNQIQRWPFLYDNN